MVRRLVLVACVAGCSSSTPVPAEPARATRFDAQLLGYATEYARWGRVDDELRWAPFLCRQPRPGIARESESGDGATHGRKLYSVFARDQAAYPTRSAVGQAVVKESWRAEAVTDPGAKWDPEGAGTPGEGDHFYPYAMRDGKLYRAAERAGLFVMFKADPAGDTDAGWVYGTVSVEGRVTSAGRVASCMGCHEDAPHERLFGVPKAP